MSAATPPRVAADVHFPSGTGCGLRPTCVTHVAALQSDVTGIDGNLTTAASVAVVENTVTTAIDDLDELAEAEF